MPKKELQAFLDDLNFVDFDVVGLPGRTAIMNGPNSFASNLGQIYDKLMKQEAWLQFSSQK